MLNRVSHFFGRLSKFDAEILCALIQIFDVSLDALCGIVSEEADTVIDEIEKDIQKDTATYHSLYSRWEMIEKQLIAYPTNDRLLFAALRFLRTTHDRVENDAQKNAVNAHILKISERLLDFSRNDSYRSYANYNLALYYSEQVNILRNHNQDKSNAEKARMYADLTLYKDMPKTFYHFLGASSVKEDCAAKEKNADGTDRCR